MGLTIDARRVLERALAEATPGEDLDEALLRACKALHPQHPTELFTALSQMLQALGQPGDASRLDTLRRLASAQGSMTISLESNLDTAGHGVPFEVHAGPIGLSVKRTVTISRTGVSLDQLPPEVQQKVREALGAGQARMVDESSQAPAAAGQGVPFYCRHCGHSEGEAFDRCPHCGRRQRGFLARLLGR